MPEDSVVLDVLIDLKEEGLATAEVVARELGHLNEQVKDLTQSQERLARGAHEDARALIELAGAAKVAKGATGGGGILGFVGSLAQMMPGGTVMGYAILGLVGLAAVFAPFVPLLAGAIVLLTAFTIGVGVLAATITLGLGAFVALGAAIALLANSAYTRAAAAQAAAARQAAAAAHAHTAAVNANAAAHLQLLRAQNSVAAAHHASANQLLAVTVAQQKVATTATQMAAAQYVAGVTSGKLVNPLGQVKDHLTAMADQLGFRGIPLLIQMAHWFDSLIPKAQEMGNQLMTWFADRLPLVLPIMSHIVDTLVGAFKAMGAAIGSITDYVISHPALLAFFDQMVGWGVAIGSGLLANLLRLSSWFLERWPAIEKIVLPIIGGIGNAIQGMGSVFGGIVDYFLKKWPDFTEAARKAADFFKGIWNNPLIQEGLKELKGEFKLVIDHLYELQPLIPAFGAAITGMALGVEGGIGGLLALALVMERIVAAGKWIVEHGGKPLPGPGGGITDRNALGLGPDPNALQLSTPPGSPGEHGRPSSLNPGGIGSTITNNKALALLSSIDGHLSALRQQAGLQF